MLAVSKFQYVVHLCKLFECSTLIFKNCAVSEVAIEKYVGLHTNISFLSKFLWGYYWDITSLCSHMSHMWAGNIQILRGFWGYQKD